MKNFNEHIIYKDPEQCLSVKVVERYLSGKLSDKEQAMVAKHLEHCSFCKEAIEGTVLLKEPEQLSAITKGINTRINRKLLVKPAFLGVKIAAAAVVLILFSVGIYGYLNFSNAERASIYAENFSKYPDKLNMDSVILNLNTEDSVEEAAPEVESIPAIAANKMKEQITESKVENVKEVTAQKEPTFNMDMAPPPPAQEKVVSSPKPASATIQQREMKDLNTAQTTDELNEVQITSGSVSKVENIFKKAISLFDNNQYPEAIELFDQVKEEQLYQEQSLLYSGISYLQLGQPQKAIENFDQLLNIKNSTLEETALWYKALSYIKLDNIKEAKSILKKVINKNGVYKEKAEKLRNSL